MTIGETLLDLTVEYQAAKERHEGWPSLPGTPAGRTPQVIAAEYAEALKELLSPVDN